VRARLCASLVAAACLALPAAASARTDAGAAAGGPTTGRSGESAIFYYPWFGSPRVDGEYIHWQQHGNRPPARVASSFYPARGAYSSADGRVVRSQMREIAAMGVDTVIVSWWGRGSLEDRRLRLVVAAAHAQRLRVAAHLEPYGGRTVVSTGDDIAYLRALGLTDFYVWASVSHPDEEWRETLGALRPDIRVFANTNFPAKAAAGGFSGVYTYDVLLYDGGFFPRMCAQARKLHLLCAPSVGPGYDARRATADRRLRGRRGGATYDAMWTGALRAGADVVTITSYNEWHEGTQIEPARRTAGYASYDGAWGLRGRAAEGAYVERTAYWTRRLARGRLPSE
jgi:glycoprotein endo-alpha-1,2-mannosidase